MSSFPNPINSSAGSHAMSVHKTPDVAKTSTGLSVKEFDALPAKDRKEIIDKFMETNSGRKLMGAAGLPKPETDDTTGGASGSNPIGDIAGTVSKVAQLVPTPAGAAIGLAAGVMEGLFKK